MELKLYVIITLFIILLKSEINFKPFSIKIGNWSWKASILYLCTMVSLYHLVGDIALDEYGKGVEDAIESIKSEYKLTPKDTTHMENFTERDE